MSTPTLPPYMGSWEELVQALLHNPSLGGGGGGHKPVTHLEAAMRNPSDGRNGPSPIPWFGVMMILSAITQKQIAESLPEGNLRQQMITAAQSVLDDDIDDWCPTRPHPHFPHWWGILIAAQLGEVAASLPEGALQTEVLAAAQKGLQNTLGLTASHAAAENGAGVSIRVG